MSADLDLRRKLTLRAAGRGGPQKVVFVKKPVESLEHVLMKAFLWALYLPDYPALSIEVPIGDRYKPDLVQLNARGEPLFWGESGRVGLEKVRSLTRRFPDTHFAVAKWAERLDPHVALVEGALGDRPRRAPFDLLAFPPDAATRFIADDGTITVAFDDVERVRLGV
ncbi:MAG: hypothetical protein R3181_09570 [Rubricoccaceae bacterium]|nr:hypothetical protein [Rubricoccaceae bacterium]